MADNKQHSPFSAKDYVMQHSKQLLKEAPLWALIRTDKNGAIHIHTESKAQFLALMFGVFKEEPELKEDLDMMFKFEAQRIKK